MTNKKLENMLKTMFAKFSTKTDNSKERGDAEKEILLERYSSWKNKDWKRRTTGTLIEVSGAGLAGLGVYAFALGVGSSIEDISFIETFKDNLLPLIENYHLSDGALSILNAEMIYGIVGKLFPYLERKIYRTKNQ